MEEQANNSQQYAKGALAAGKSAAVVLVEVSIRYLHSAAAGVICAAVLSQRDG